MDFTPIVRLPEGQSGLPPGKRRKPFGATEGRAYLNRLPRKWEHISDLYGGVIGVLPLSEGKWGLDVVDSTPTTSDESDDFENALTAKSPLHRHEAWRIYTTQRGSVSFRLNWRSDATEFSALDGLLCKALMSLDDPSMFLLDRWLAAYTQGAQPSYSSIRDEFQETFGPVFNLQRSELCQYIRGRRDRDTPGLFSDLVNSALDSIVQRFYAKVRERLWLPVATTSRLTQDVGDDDFGFRAPCAGSRLVFGPQNVHPQSMPFDAYGWLVDHRVMQTAWEHWRRFYSGWRSSGAYGNYHIDIIHPPRKPR